MPTATSWWRGESSFEDGNGLSVRARPFNALGVAQSAPFPVNAFTTGDQRSPSVALDGAGEFVVTWQSANQDLNAEGVFERRFDWPATPLHGDLRVNTYTIGSQHSPVVARNASGNFMIAWTSVGQDGSADGIFAQALDAAGSVQGPNFQVNTLTDSNQSYPAVAADGLGSFLVTWSSSFPEGDGGVYARKYGSAGTPTSPEFHMNTYTTGRQAFSSWPRPPTGGSSWPGLATVRTATATASSRSSWGRT